VGVYVCVSMCIRTHTHTLHRCSDVSPGVGMRHLEGPKNPDGLNLDIHIFVYVYKVHMCLLRGQTFRGLTPQNDTAKNPATWEKPLKDGQRSTPLTDRPYESCKII